MNVLWDTSLRLHRFSSEWPAQTCTSVWNKPANNKHLKVQKPALSGEYIDHFKSQSPKPAMPASDLEAESTDEASRSIVPVRILSLGKSLNMKHRCQDLTNSAIVE